METKHDFRKLYHNPMHRVQKFQLYKMWRAIISRLRKWPNHHAGSSKGPATSFQVLAALFHYTVVVHSWSNIDRDDPGSSVWNSQDICRGWDISWYLTDWDCAERTLGVCCSLSNILIQILRFPSLVTPGIFHFKVKKFSPPPLGTVGWSENKIKFGISSRCPCTKTTYKFSVTEEEGKPRQ